MKKQKRPPRIRRLVQFWLDEQMEDDRELLGIITELRRTREFTRIIRDGIRLMLELRGGRVDMLLTLFPNVVEWLELRTVPPPVDTSKLEAKIDHLEKILLERGIEIPPSDVWMIPPAYKPGRALPPKPINDTPMVAANDDSSQTFLDAFM